MTVTKVWAEEEERLLDVTKDAMKQGLGIDADDLDSEATCIKSVSCEDCDLTFLLHHPKSTMGRLDSKHTPIFISGVDITLPPIRYEMPPAESTPKKAKKSALDVLVGKEVLNLQYLQCKYDADKSQEINEQCKEKVYAFYEEIDLGHSNPRQKDQLSKNATHIKKAMCFIQKHWKVLLRASFPKIPDSGEDYVNSKLLEALAETNRAKKNW